MKLFVCVMVLASLAVAAGCTMPRGPILASLAVNEKGPVAGFSPDAKSTRQGVAVAEGVILVGFGDASISAAKIQGGISKIHHVDSETLNIFGIYSRYKTIVYGE